MHRCRMGSPKQRRKVQRHLLDEERLEEVTRRHRELALRRPPRGRRFEWDYHCCIVGNYNDIQVDNNINRDSYVDKMTSTFRGGLAGLEPILLCWHQVIRGRGSKSCYYLDLNFSEDAEEVHAMNGQSR